MSLETDLKKNIKEGVGKSIEAFESTRIPGKTVKASDLKK